MGEWVSVWSPAVLTTQAWLELSTQISSAIWTCWFGFFNKEIDFIYTEYIFSWEHLYKGSK